MVWCSFRKHLLRVDESAHVCKQQLSLSVVFYKVNKSTWRGVGVKPEGDNVLKFLRFRAILQ